MPKPLTETEKRAVLAELSWFIATDNYTSLRKFLDLLPPETLRDYISDVMHHYTDDNTSEVK